MLGHASAAMTLDVYADLIDSDLDSVAESMAKLWANSVDAPTPVDASIDSVATQTTSVTLPLADSPDRQGRKSRARRVDSPLVATDRSENQ